MNSARFLKVGEMKSLSDASVLMRVESERMRHMMKEMTSNDKELQNDKDDMKNMI